MKPGDIAAFDWREQHAYALGVLAYIYAFPWTYMPDARWTRTESIQRQANRFDHVRKLVDASHVMGGAPNNDTLYSRAWIYLKDEPVILSVPAIRDRYYTMEIVEALARDAGERLHRLGYDNVEVRQGNGRLGWPEHAPYDAILVAAAARRIPQALIEQLKPGGILVIPIGEQHAAQDLTVIRKQEDGRVEQTHVLPVAFVPLTGAANR